MRIKLTRAQFEAFFYVVRMALRQPSCTDPRTYHERIEACLLSRIYKKLHAKSVDVKQHYSVKLADEEALVVGAVFCDHRYDNKSFEGNFLNMLLSDICKHYGV